MTSIYYSGEMGDKVGAAGSKASSLSGDVAFSGRRDNSANLLLSLASASHHGSVATGSSKSAITPSPHGMSIRDDRKAEEEEEEAADDGRLVMSVHGENHSIHHSPIKIAPFLGKPEDGRHSNPPQGSPTDVRLPSGKRDLEGEDERPSRKARTSNNEQRDAEGDGSNAKNVGEESAAKSTDGGNRIISPTSSNEGHKAEEEDRTIPQEPPPSLDTVTGTTGVAPFFAAYGGHGYPVPPPGHYGHYLGPFPPPPPPGGYMHGSLPAPYYSPAHAHASPHVMYPPPFSGYPYGMSPEGNPQHGTSPRRGSETVQEQSVHTETLVDRMANEFAEARQPKRSKPKPKRMSPPTTLSLDPVRPDAKRCITRQHMVPPADWQEQVANAECIKMPDFHRLVNYPDYLTRGRSTGSSPDGKRPCVMCGELRVCSQSVNRTTSRQQSQPEGESIQIIPRQNKGVCTACDVAVWVVLDSDAQPVLEIKWCKGCKNFRPWAAFGDKVLATKCSRCRERQKEKYAQQKGKKASQRKKEDIRTLYQDDVLAATGLRNLMHASHLDHP